MLLVHARESSGAREQHGTTHPRWQESYCYSDGTGREVMRKIPAEPGEVPLIGPDGKLVRHEDGTKVTVPASPRWVGNGRTVFDNKGNPVKHYEPYFSATADYEDEPEIVEQGVTPILRYDPLGRLIRTDLPNGTFTKVELDPWKQTSFDPNDTVLESTWYQARKGLPGSDPEGRAAQLASAHANTPAIAHLDTSVVPFLCSSWLGDAEEKADDSGGSSAVDIALGVAYGTLQAYTPFGCLAPSPAPQSRDFEIARGGAQVVGGIVQIYSGISLIMGGGAAAAGGVVGAPFTGGASLLVTMIGGGAVAAGWAAVAQGAMNVIAGSNTLANAPALSTGGGSASPAGSGSASSSAEQQRLKELGKDPSGKFRQGEQDAAQRLESQVGRLRRDPSGAGDWIDESGKVYDAVGPVPSQHFDATSFTRQIDRHLLKQGVDTIVVDLTGLNAAQVAAVRNYLNGLSGARLARIIVQ